jgi:hypothetical protein
MLELLQDIMYRGWLPSEGILYTRKFSRIFLCRITRYKYHFYIPNSTLSLQLHSSIFNAHQYPSLIFLVINGIIFPTATMGCMPCCLRSRKPPPTPTISLPLHDKFLQFSSFSSRTVLTESFIPQRSAPPSPTLEFRPPPPNNSTNSPLALHIPSPEIKQTGLSIDDYKRITQLAEQLIHLLKAHSNLITLTHSQTLHDIDSILAGISAPSPSHNTLSSLRRSITNLYNQKETIQTTYFLPATSTILSKLSSFSALDPAQQIKQARVLRESCLLMQIFTLLKSIRTGCEELRKVDGGVRWDFEDILAGLKDEEGGGKGKGASMRWRVFELVEGQRRGVLAEGIEGILRGRVGISGALLGVVEELKEG